MFTCQSYRRNRPQTRRFQMVVSRDAGGKGLPAYQTRRFCHAMQREADLPDVGMRNIRRTFTALLADGVPSFPMTRRL